MPISAHRESESKIRGISHEFEEVLEEQKSEQISSSFKPQMHSVEIGMDAESTHEAATDVRNLVDVNNFGCNTQSVNTDEK